MLVGNSNLKTDDGGIGVLWFAGTRPLRYSTTFPDEVNDSRVFWLADLECVSFFCVENLDVGNVVLAENAFLAFLYSSLEEHPIQKLIAFLEVDLRTD
jgi:hypothetical protein